MIHTLTKSVMLPIAAFGAAAILSTAAAAQPVGGVVVRGVAPPDVEVKTQTVSYRDIDANSPDGARILFHRIRTAAEKVCAPAPPNIDKLPEYKDYQNYALCQLDSINLAVNDVNSPALTRYVDSLR
jgi:UrcA family protein